MIPSLSDVTRVFFAIVFVLLAWFACAAAVSYLRVDLPIHRSLDSTAPVILEARRFAASSGRRLIACRRRSSVVAVCTIDDGGLRSLYCYANGCELAPELRR